jgi:hypothetical protein
MKLRRFTAQPIERRALIATIGTADAMILVDVDDIAAHAASDLAQLAFLVGRGLLQGRDPQAENSAFHRKPPSSTARIINR